jgi:uncharacterized protein YjbI with pentapeptide repeats
MSEGFVYKLISKKRIADLNSGDLPENAVFEALKSGEFNNSRCKDFRFTSWGTENTHVKNFVWKRGKFRGDFTNCTFSDGEIEEVDFWDSDFKNVTFRNVYFTEGEINSSYSDKFAFGLDNVVFENCVFHRFTIGQAFNSRIYLNGCKIINSNFYLKSSYIEFCKCETQKGEKVGSVCIGVFDSKNIEPIKIKECLFFELKLIGEIIGILNVSAKDFHLELNYNIKIKNLKIYCNRFDLDTTCENSQQLNEVKKRYETGLSPDRILDNIEITCSKGGVFGILGFKINTLKLSMTEERPKSESGIFYCQINHFEAVGFKTDGLTITECTINKANFRSCHFNELELGECIIPELSLNSVKIAKKMVLNKTKIGRLTLERVSLDKKADWESESSVVALLDKPESKQKDIKDVSGQTLARYFDRADVGLSK